MIRTHLARTPWLSSLLIAMGMLSIAGAAQAADTGLNGDDYTWSARLVAVDSADRTATLESLVVDVDGLDNAADLHAGDHAVLAWSGITWAAGVRGVTPGMKSEYDGLTLPIEFVSTEMNDRYVRFKVRVPSTDIAALESLSSGEWVTATSPRHASSPDEAVISIRPYNAVSKSSS